MGEVEVVDEERNGCWQEEKQGGRWINKGNLADEYPRAEDNKEMNVIKAKFK